MRPMGYVELLTFFCVTEEILKYRVNTTLNFKNDMPEYSMEGIENIEKSGTPQTKEG